MDEPMGNQQRSLFGNGEERSTTIKISDKEKVDLSFGDEF
jgi:hypothetical protein